MQKNCYEILGIDKSATQQQITKAYHDLVKKWHPDKCTDKIKKTVAKQRTSEINKAYERIKCAKKRQEYDEELEEQQSLESESVDNFTDNISLSSLSSSSSDSVDSMTSSQFKRNLRELNIEINGLDSESDYEDYEYKHQKSYENEDVKKYNERMEQKFQDFLKQKNKGADLNVDLHLTLEELNSGVRKLVVVDRNITRFNTEKYTFEIDVGVGTRENDTVVVPEFGNYVMINGRLGKCPGDAVVHVKCIPHDKFKKNDYDLLTTCEITLQEALKGFSKTIVGLNKKKFTINVDPIEKTNYVHVVENKGLTRSDGSIGNMCINFIVNLKKK